MLDSIKLIVFLTREDLFLLGSSHDYVLEFVTTVVSNLLILQFKIPQKCYTFKALLVLHHCMIVCLDNFQPSVFCNDFTIHSFA